MKMLRRLTLIGLAATALDLCASGAVAAEFYYVLIFGSQSHPKLLRNTHTWATFVKATGEGTDPDNYTLEMHTISWLPASGKVKVFRPWPETGMNLDLYQTLDFVYKKKENVTLWGPFQCAPLIWQRSLEVKAELESGKFQYRAISNARDFFISDCIHAVAAIDPQFGRNHYPLVRVGDPASRFIARQSVLRGVIDNRALDHSWLIPRLSLDRYPIKLIPPANIPDRPCFLCRIPEKPAN